MTTRVPLMRSRVESSYGAAPGAAPSPNTPTRSSWKAPAAMAGVLLLGVVGTLISVDGTVFGPSSPLTRLGAAKADDASPAPLVESEGSVADLEQDASLGADEKDLYSTLTNSQITRKLFQKKLK